MKVSELISQLQELPCDMPVKLFVNHTCFGVQQVFKFVERNCLHAAKDFGTATVFIVAR